MNFKSVLLALVTLVPALAGAPPGPEYVCQREAILECIKIKSRHCRSSLS